MITQVLSLKMSGGDLNRSHRMKMRKKSWKEFSTKRIFPDRI
jgi:hypothetical protein